MPKRLGYFMAMPGETAPNQDEMRSMAKPFDNICYASSGTWFETQLPGTRGWRA